MPVKLVIFDLDGTLIDSSADITGALNFAIEPYGPPPISVPEALGLIGEGLTRLMEKLIEKQGVQADRDLLLGRFLDYYSEHLLDNTTLYPGVKETLETLVKYKKAVISNKREALSARLINELGLSSLIDMVVGSDTANARKPSPAPVLYVLEKLGVNPSEAVIVGDSNYDIESGRAAGINTIAVTYGYRPIDFLRGADHIINKMDELPDILMKI